MARLSEQSTRQILTRISFHAALRPLTRQEVAAYVQHRLLVAGSDHAVFTRCALFALWRASKGLPRLINILAAKAMMLAFGRGGRQVNCRHVLGAARDTLATRGHAWLPWLWLAGLLGLTVASLGILRALG
jgi:MSHA biogenesis protein MshM